MNIKWKIRGSHLLLLSFVVLSCTASFAATHSKKNYKAIIDPHTPGYYELIAAGSVSSVIANDGEINISSLETDKLNQTNDGDWDSWGGQLGIGYVYFIANAKQYSDNLQWFPMVEPQVNIYYNTYRNDGDVQRYLNNIPYTELDYSMLIHSTRVMFDVALTVASKREFSTYVIAGIGGSQNSVDYSDIDSTCNTQNLSMDGNPASFVWEVGAGVAYNLKDKASLTFEYLYTDFGKLNISDQALNGGNILPLASTSNFNLQAQALLLGLHVKL